MSTLKKGAIVWWNSCGESQLPREIVSLLPGLPDLDLKKAVGKAVQAFAKKAIASNPAIPANMRKVKGYKFLSDKDHEVYGLVYPVVVGSMLDMPVIFNATYDKSARELSLTPTGALPEESVREHVAEFRRMVDVYLNTYSSAEISNGLKSVLDNNNAVQIRKNGTVYFLREKDIEAVKEIATKLAPAGITLGMVSVAGDDENLPAIRTQVFESLNREVTALQDEIRKACASGLSDTVYRSKMKALQDLWTRVHGFSDSMTSCRSVLDSINVTASAVNTLLLNNKPVDLDEMIRNMGIAMVPDATELTVPDKKEMDARRAEAEAKALAEEQAKEVTVIRDTLDKVSEVKREELKAKLENLDTEGDFAWALS